MASTRKVKSNAPTVTRKRHSEEFKREALALAERIGVNDAARERPDSPILGLTPDRATARRLALVWGVHAVHDKEHHEATDMAHVVEEACRIALEEGFARPGQALVIAAGLPFGVSGTTNSLRIAWVGESQQ